MRVVAQIHEKFAGQVFVLAEYYQFGYLAATLFSVPPRLTKSIKRILNVPIDEGGAAA